jgi:hypothetical protein
MRMAPEPFHLIGADCSLQILAAETDERHLVPRASDGLHPALRQLIEHRRGVRSRNRTSRLAVTGAARVAGAHVLPAASTVYATTNT